MPDVFMSYCRRDKPLADRLVADLRCSGVAVWYDNDDIFVGHDILDAVYDGIRNSRILAIVVTKNSTASRWVQQELNIATISAIEQDQTTIVPLLFEDCPLPRQLEAKPTIDFRGSYAVGLAPLLEAVRFPSLPLVLTNSKTEMEDAVTAKQKEIAELSYTLLRPVEENDREYVLSEDYSDENIQVLRREIYTCLNLLDHLISLEDAPSPLLNYYAQAADLSARVLDYRREAQYTALVVENADPCVDNYLVLAIANANANHKHRSTDAFRLALRMYLQQDTDWNGDSLLKFVYRVTRHIGWTFCAMPLFRDLVIFRNRSNLVERLERTMPCLDLALEREQIFDFGSKYSALSYANLLAMIGLTKRALRYYDKAKELGCTDTEIDISHIEELRRDLNVVTTPPEEPTQRRTTRGHTAGLVNFFMQLGIGPSDFESLIRDYAPEFYKDVIEDDAIFTRSLKKQRTRAARREFSKGSRGTLT
jgi:tetratricopeptide (TPR) repeat protein